MELQQNLSKVKKVFIPGFSQHTNQFLCAGLIRMCLSQQQPALPGPTAWWISTVCEKSFHNKRISYVTHSLLRGSHFSGQDWLSVPSYSPEKLWFWQESQIQGQTEHLLFTMSYFTVYLQILKKKKKWLISASLPNTNTFHLPSSLVVSTGISKVKEAGPAMLHY